MAGGFSKSNRPKRPGAYFNFEAVAQDSVLPSTGSVVALPIVHDWGPYEVVTRIGSLAEFRSIFGPTETTPGFKAVKGVFQGEGVPGSGGAGEVLAFRMGGAAGAKATRTLQNTTPATALTLTARYEGSYGNGLTVTTQDYAADSGKNELILLLNGAEVERYRYTDTDITALAVDINANSDWVTAVANISGVALSAVSASAFAAGNDGSTLLAGDWTAAMDALEPFRFSVMAPYDLTDSGILASLKTWAVNANAAGKRFEVCVGGALGESVSTAVTRSGTLNDENFINLGVGTVEDEAFGDMSTSQLAPRIAGILANIGGSRNLTFCRLAGVTLKVGATESQILTAFEGGVTVLSLGSDPVAPVRIEKGLTTFTSTSIPNKPYTIFRTPKYVRTMHLLQTELQEWADLNVVGKLPVNSKTRDYVLGEVKNRLKLKELANEVQAGWTVDIDPDPPASDDDEFIAVAIGLKFGRSSEQVFFTTRIA